MKQNISNLVCAPADEGGSGVSGTLAQAKQNVTQTARDTAAKIKSTAGQTASRAKDEAQRIAQEKKETAASRVGGYSSALHESASSLEEQDPNIAFYAHKAADRLQNAAEYIRNRDFAGLRADVEGLARRHPAAFFGGMFVAGLIVGNLLTASGRNSRSAEFEEADPANDWADDINRGEGQTESNFPGASAAGI